MRGQGHLGRFPIWKQNFPKGGGGRPNRLYSWYLAEGKTLSTGKMGRLGVCVGETSVSRYSLQLTPNAVLEPEYNPFKGFTHKYLLIVATAFFTLSAKSPVMGPEFGRQICKVILVPPALHQDFQSTVQLVLVTHPIQPT